MLRPLSQGPGYPTGQRLPQSLWEGQEIAPKRWAGSVQALSCHSQAGVEAQATAELPLWAYELLECSQASWFDMVGTAFLQISSDSISRHDRALGVLPGSLTSREPGAKIWQLNV